MAAFKLAINMPGAISAGAYTAGVLDFLTQALDAWYKAKQKGDPVQAHDISIEAFTGASAGGMCAAISAILLQDNFEHISDTTKTGTSNRFYESWVNRIDISELLKTGDLARTPQPVVSLLDSSIIEDIANFAIQRGEPLAEPRPYVSPTLTLFLSLTNLRAVPYSLNQVSPDSVEQTAFFYGDRIRFETLRTPGLPPLSAVAHKIDLSGDQSGPAWQTLRTSAMATGAFPVFLAPRVLNRSQAEYTPPMWESVGSKAQSTPPPLSPTFPDQFPDPFQTLNVDGGVTNNDPYNYAHDFLSALDPPSGTPTRLPAKAAEVDRAVLTIAPFPTVERYPTTFDTASNASILRSLPRLFAALIAQSRFFGESLPNVMSGTSFSNFIIAPSDDALVQKHLAGSPGDIPPALQCAALGAFGGFFERGFRAHDFALGRRNCQRFLQEHFVLPLENPVIAAGMPLDPAARHAIVAQFGRPAPPKQSEGTWLPLIPLCGLEVATPVPPVPRFRMQRAKLEATVKLILRRFRAVVTALLDPIPSAPLRLFLKAGQPAIVFLARKPLIRTLTRQLGDSIEQ